MIRARIQNGRLKLLGRIPKSWEGCVVTIQPADEEHLTPDDPIPDLEERLAAIQALLPARWAPGEREQFERDLKEMDRISREKMERLADRFV